jgi:hypothetical protein
VAGNRFADPQAAEYVPEDYRTGAVTDRDEFSVW